MGTDMFGTRQGRSLGPPPLPWNSQFSGYRPPQRPQSAPFQQAPPQWGNPAYGPDGWNTIYNPLPGGIWPPPPGYPHPLRWQPDNSPTTNIGPPMNPGGPPPPSSGPPENIGDFIDPFDPNPPGGGGPGENIGDYIPVPMGMTQAMQSLQGRAPQGIRAPGFGRSLYQPSGMPPGGGNPYMRSLQGG